MPMKKIAVYVDEGTHSDLLELARQKHVSVSELARTSIILVLEDDLDAVALDTRLGDGDPDAYATWEEFKERIARERPNVHLPS